MPAILPTDVLTTRQLAFVAERLSEPRKPQLVGRTMPIATSCPASCGCFGLDAVGGTSTGLAPRPASRIGAGCATGIEGGATAKSGAPS
jgi:hypothetical protein